MTVVARDSGHPQRNASARIVIEVLDYNDNPPAFARAAYHASVGEDALPGTVVAQVSVHDPDVPQQEEDALDDDDDAELLTYYIVQGNEAQHFQVRASGQVFVARRLDREMRPAYELQLVASDGFFTSRAWLHVELTDENDNGPVCVNPVYETTVSEAAAPGTPLLAVLTTDADLTNAALPRFSLAGEGAGMFLIDEDSGEISVARPLDRETQPHFSLTATVRDRDHEDWLCTTQVEIQVSDVNDNPPAFSQTSYSVNVPENSPENLLLLKVHASDPDKGMNRKVSYSLHSADEGDDDEENSLFDIHPSTGIIRVLQSLDREEQAMYNLTVTATDHGSPVLAASVNVLVLVSGKSESKISYIFF